MHLYALFTIHENQSSNHSLSVHSVKRKVFYGASTVFQSSFLSLFYFLWHLPFLVLVFISSSPFLSPFECHVSQLRFHTTFSSLWAFCHIWAQGIFHSGQHWVLWEISPEMKPSPEKMQQFMQVKQTRPRNHHGHVWRGSCLVTEGQMFAAACQPLLRTVYLFTNLKMLND